MDAQTMGRAPRTKIRAHPRDRRPHRASGETAATAGDAGQTGLISSPSSPQRWPAEVRAATAIGIVVNGRNVAVPDHFRMHVAKKMAHVDRYDNKITRYSVELLHEKNRRQSKLCQRIQITGTGQGPVVRATASGPDFYAALAAALATLENRLRRSHDRRRVHHGRHRITSVAQATAA